MTSFSACAVAVRRVVTNQGGKTPGIDGVVWNSPEKKFEAIQQVLAITRNPKSYKASPVKRVLIPKPGTSEMRPLGIPTMIDRAVQAVYHMAIDPVVEVHSDPNSYGFRKYRSTHDAITTLRTLLDKPHSARWILETDVAKCFDKIDHGFLMEHTPIADRNVLEQWLQSGVMEQGKFSESTEGTPQGGIISPMLCNVALNGVEKVIDAAFPGRFCKEGTRPKIHLIRYADDLVITGQNEELLLEAKEVLIEFLRGRGLTIKEAKTRLVHINEGFDFLGFNIRRFPTDPAQNKTRKQDTVLVIKPADKGVVKIQEKISSIIRVDRSLEKIILELNPILRGWSEYYRVSYHSLSVFKQLHNYVWVKMWKWCRKKHPRKTAKELRSMYLVPHPTLKWVFGKSPTMQLFSLCDVTSYRLRPLKLVKNPYIRADIGYFEDRRAKRVDARFRSAVYKRYQYKCPLCGQSLFNGEQVDLHHIQPAALGGKYTLSNIQPLHQTCHQQVTYGRREIIK